MWESVVVSYLNVILLLVRGESDVVSYLIVILLLVCGESDVVSYLNVILLLVCGESDVVSYLIVILLLECGESDVVSYLNVILLLFFFQFNLTELKVFLCSMQWLLLHYVSSLQQSKRECINMSSRQVVESSTDGNVYASQFPQYCYTGQTPTTVSSPGGLIVLTASLPPESSGLTAGASAGIAIGVLLILLILLLLIGFCIYKKTRKVDPGPIPPDQGVPPAETKMPTEDKSRPDIMRNIRPFNHSNMRRNDDMDIEDIEDRDKVPRLERDLTQHSTLRQQIITPSVVNPMVREWSDMGYSDDLTLIDSENMHDQLDPPSPIPEGLTPVEGFGPVYGYWNTVDERHAPEKKKKKKKKKSKKDEPLLKDDSESETELQIENPPGNRPRSMKSTVNTTAMHVPSSTLPFIEGSDKVPTLSRDLTRQSIPTISRDATQQSIITPRAINPSVREWYDKEMEKTIFLAAAK
ncbi:unnamed protein product [Mytilus coruscus]|uniref:Uncharacterized protein n=1 Tax=Mytilus coruscus TaxID=42192 RepID=A0A6J7ZY60_MYTCO|nr:unnamed protein product [Mytilus coruscus]